MVLQGVSGSPNITCLQKNAFFFFTLLALKVNITLINLIVHDYTIQLS